MTTPRILLVPYVTELEWRIKPRLEDWAEVISFDGPGVGTEPAGAPTRDGVAARGLEKVDERGWTGCVVVADELGVPAALRIAEARPDLVEGLALGHACLDYGDEGERAALAPGVNAALEHLVRMDYRSFARAMTQGTLGAYDDEVAEAWIQRVPQELAIAAIEAARTLQPVQDNAATLARLDVPLLFAEHVGCLGWTREGFEDAARTFPEALTISTGEKPSASAEFADAIRELCTRVGQ